MAWTQLVSNSIMIAMGPNASHRHARDVPAMSASHPITTELVRHNEPALRAIRRICSAAIRMQVDRNTQVLHALPEREIHVGVEIVAVGLAVDERALESKLFDGTLEFR